MSEYVGKNNNLYKEMMVSQVGDSKIKETLNKFSLYISEDETCVIFRYVVYLIFANGLSSPFNDKFFKIASRYGDISSSLNAFEMEDFIKKYCIPKMKVPGDIELNAMPTMMRGKIQKYGLENELGRLFLYTVIYCDSVYKYRCGFSKIDIIVDELMGLRKLEIGIDSFTNRAYIKNNN